MANYAAEAACQHDGSNKDSIKSIEVIEQHWELNKYATAYGQSEQSLPARCLSGICKIVDRDERSRELSKGSGFY